MMKTKRIHNDISRLPIRFALCAGISSAILWVAGSTWAADAADTKAPTASPATSTAVDPSAKSEDRTDSTYPQTFDAGTHEIIKYQPQIDEWKDFKYLKARMAVAIQKKDSEEEPKYISIEFEADTVVDKEAGVVYIGPRRVQKLIFVDAKDDAEKAALKAILMKAGDGQNQIKVSLDAMVANVDQTAVMNRDITVNMDPPPIFYSEEPAVMVAFMGEPDFKAVDPKTNKVLFALNTNWDILMDVASSTYYLLIEDGWIKTKDLKKGPWEIVKTVPESFSSLPDDDNWKDVRAALKADAFETVPKVFVSDRPAELIEVEGKPKMSPISGTSLMVISNTESDIFFYPSDSHYYYLVEGRWFKSKDMTTGWEAASMDLPAEFGKIPEDHEKAYVLASVQGSKVAEEAAVKASIPETATLERKDTTVKVEYDGEPKFEPIKGSKDVQYAVNTQNDVFLSNAKYYCCSDGAWFTAPSPTGPWVLCDNVDKAIYSIPASAPQHNVTYVQVYNTTPTTVQYGYTSGYTGQYLFRGLLVFGAGYWLGHHHSHHHWYRPSYIGWGCGARWGWHGGYHRPSHWGYGPYGGIVRPVHYGHGHGYHRPHHYYGHHRPGHSRPGYSPWRPRPGHAIGRPVPYGSWGNKAKLDNRMARNRYNKGINNRLRPVTRPSTRPNLRPVTRPVAGRPGSRPGLKPGLKPGTRPGIKPGGGASIQPVRPGTRPSTRPSTRPDVYVGKNGNIYKKDKSGKWQQRDQSGWKNTNMPTRPTTRPSTRPGSGGAGVRPGTKPAVRPGTRPSTRPGIKPGGGSTVRPGGKPSTRPTTRPKTRPTTRPSARPTTRPTYKSTRPTPSKLNHDSRTRSRASSQRSSYNRSSSHARRSTPTRSARSRTSSRPSRSSGGGRSRGGGGRGRR